MSLSLIIPLYNESENITNLINNLNDFFSSHKELKTEIIFVDDGSTDQSVKLLTEANFLPFYTPKLVKLSKNFGSHAALRAGIKNSTAEYTIFLYADLQDPISLITDLYAKIKEGYDIVWANRKKNKGSSGKMLSAFYALLMQNYAIKGFPINGFDIVMFNSKVKRELNDNIEGNSSLFLQILSLGFNQTSISYEKGERKIGKSKWTFSKKLKLFIDSFVAFSYAPIRLVTVAGIIFSILGFIWTIYIIGRTLLVGDLSPGWPALIAVLMIGFGITNISLGIIAEYLWRTLDSSRKRKVFIIDDFYDLRNQT